MRTEIEDLLRTRLDGLKDENLLISSFLSEDQTNKGYNGRQILEMFQNCEDQGAKSVDIILDKSSKKLTIANKDGEPFSKLGYRSLFYPSVSSKVSSGFIGNKGLGFRSLVNWSKEIIINSNEFSLKFSESNKEQILINQLNYSKDQIQKIREERNLMDNVLPLPLLNSGILYDLPNNHDYTTSIVINYKEDFEKDIEKQLDELDFKTLLFLNNITDVNILRDGVRETISIIRLTINDQQIIEHQGNQYYILSDEGPIPSKYLTDIHTNGEKNYSVKIAYCDNLSLSSEVLYNFFKTKIRFELPFIAHASLELDQNRNHETVTPINDFVFEKLWNLHKRLIEILKTSEQKSWLPFYVIAGFKDKVCIQYKNLIDNEYKSLEIVPTFDGLYKGLSKVRRLSNGLTKFIEDQTLYCDELRDIALPIPIVLSELNQDIKTVDDSTYQINAISKIIEKISTRAEFINLLISDNCQDRVSVLIDADKVLIDGDEYIYTSKTTNNEDIRVPSYSKLRFIDNELQEKLLDELNLVHDLHKSRSLAERLSKISHVHSFEPQTVIKKIIAVTNEILDKDESNFNDILKEFYEVTYHNYKLRGAEDSVKLEYEGRIPCLNQKSQLKDIKLMRLNSSYPSQSRFEAIFSDTYDLEDTMTDLVNLGFENNPYLFESFFLWLGVNCGFIYGLKDISHSQYHKGYVEYLKRQCNNKNGFNARVYVINSFNEILEKNLDINKVIEWLHFDPKIEEVFKNFSRKNSDQESVSFLNAKYIISDYENLILCSIKAQFRTTNYLINKKQTDEWFNPFKISYEYFENKGIAREEINKILKFLGAKENFIDLNIDYLREQTNNLAYTNIKNGAQVFYKNLVMHYKHNGEKIHDVNLFARVGDEIKVCHSSEIYFSDRIQIPESLTNKFPILYYPSRSGARKAIELFGLKDLNDLDLNVSNYQIDENLQDEFDVFLNRIKPFILAYRLENISQQDVISQQVNLINNIHIKICKELTCTLDGNSLFIADYDYVSANKFFYIKIPQNTTIESAINNKVFADNLSDVFLKLFDTSEEKHIFETIIRQDNEDNTYDINRNLGEGALEIASSYINGKSFRFTLWESIFKIKGLSVEDLNERTIFDAIQDSFSKKIIVQDFYSIGSISDLSAFRDILTQLKITLKDFNEVSKLNISFTKLFTNELKQAWYTQNFSLKNQLWNFINNETNEEKKRFLSSLNKISSFPDDLVKYDNEMFVNADEFIQSKLKKIFPNYNFITDEEVISIESYKSVFECNKDKFTDEEINILKEKNKEFYSLLYFQGTIDEVKGWLNDNKDSFSKNSGGVKKNALTIHLDESTIELLENIDIESSTSDLPKKGRIKNGNEEPYLGGSGNELSNDDKKKLGKQVENAVYSFLKNWHYATSVDLVTDSNEGLHYDISYYNTSSNSVKFVECKYFNGYSFLLSREEKIFAEENIEQYEIWLVDKNSKIYRIDNFNKLGNIETQEYRINLKINVHEHQL